jgi:hypothetical protein
MLICLPNTKIKGIYIYIYLYILHPILNHIYFANIYSQRVWKDCECKFDGKEYYWKRNPVVIFKFQVWKGTLLIITTDVVSTNLDQGEVYNIMW